MLPVFIMWKFPAVERVLGDCVFYFLSREGFWNPSIWFGSFVVVVGIDEKVTEKEATQPLQETFVGRWCLLTRTMI